MAGCSANPWVYNAPPGHGATEKEVVHKPAIILDQFAMGHGVAPRWSEVAPQMRDAFVRVLLKSGKFEVITDLSLSEQVLEAVSKYGDERVTALTAIREKISADTAYLVRVTITDFLHTSDAPKSVQKLRWFRTSNDALVAMDITVVDVQVGKTAITEQLAASISAGDEEADQYGSLEFGSYLFWSTPLGRASSEVITDATTLLAGLQVASPGGAVITSREEGSREVSIMGGDMLEDGGVYYVGNKDDISEKYIPVDDDLGRPLRLQIEKNFFGGSVGWLLSEPAQYERVVGATLSKTPLRVTRLTSE